MAFESSAQPERVLEIVLATQRLRELLPAELRNETTLAALLARLDAAGDDGDLHARLSDSLDQIAESMEHAPVEILPVLHWRHPASDWDPFHHELMLQLRRRNYAAFDFDLADELPSGCTFTRLIWFLPTWAALVEELSGAPSAWLGRWAEAASGAVSLWISAAADRAAFPPYLQRWRLPPQTRLVPIAAPDPAAVPDVFAVLELRLDRHRDGAVPANDAPEKWQDRLGIVPDAAAFARIIADPTLTPPLAIAVFGPWGSGKSSFMREIDERIPKPALGAARSPKGPLITRTIWFNAWHYVESDLWASLAARIFDCLNEPPPPASAAVDAAAVAKAAAHRQEIVGQMQIARLAITALEQNARERVNRLEAEQQKLSAATAASQSELVKLRAGVNAVFQALGPNLEAALSQPQQATLATARKPVEELLAGARSTEEEWKRLQTSEVVPHSWRELRTHPFAYLVPFAAIVALATLNWWIPSLRDLYAQSWALVARIALPVLPFVAAGLKILRRVNAARRQYAAVLKEEQEKLIAVQKSAVAARQQDLAQTRQAIDAERKKLAELGERYSRSFSAAELKEFITLRATADDYKSGLGLLATLRHDLDRLSQLLRRQATERDAQDAPPPSVERIVLFIDDLDRCPPERVVEVLQAVHLLLAFPLFVVVMGVDSRWIASCLAKRHSEILGDEDGAALRASDYLEKIFQIPYWLAPYTRTNAGAYFRSLVRDTGQKLMRGDRPVAATDAGAGPTAANPGLDNAADTSGDHLPQGALLWTDDELAFVSSLAPFAGATPRATKRFFNLYHLLRHHPLLWPALDQRAHQHSTSTTYKAYAFALAVANSGSTGAAALAMQLQLRQSSALESVIASPAAPDVRGALEDGWTELRALDDHGTAAIEIALRLSFHGHRLMPQPRPAPVSRPSPPDRDEPFW